MATYSKIILTVTIFSLLFRTTQSSYQSNSDKLAQEEPDFEKVKALFIGKPQKIPANYLTSVLKIDSASLQYGIYISKSVEQFDKNILGLIYVYECGAGGICEKTEIVIFKDKILTDKIEIGHAYGDQSGTKLLTYELNLNKIILSHKETIDKVTSTGNTESTIISENTITKVLNLNTGKWDEK